MLGKGKRNIITFSHYGELYGANRSLLTLILSLKNEINWIVISQQEGDFTLELKKNQITYYSIPFKADVFSKSQSFLLRIVKTIFKNSFNVAILPYLIFLILRNAPAAIHSNSSVFMMGSIIAFLTGKPHIWHIREFGDLDYKVEYDFGKRWFRFWANKADYLICVSKSLRQKRLMGQDITTQSTVIYNGIDTHAPNTPATIIPSEPFSLALVGLIIPGKEQMEAIKAVEMLRTSGLDVRLRLIGGYTRNEPYYKEVRRYIKEKKLEKYIRLEGFVKNTEAIYKGCHLTLMCSRNEGMGRVTVESMLRGIPVIAFDAAGSSEMIQHDQDGILYKGDAAALAEQIRTLLTNPDKYAFIATNARLSAIKKFNVAQYKNSFLKVVDSVL